MKVQKTKGSKADFFHRDQKRFLVLDGLCVSYFDVKKHVQQPIGDAKGHLPLWIATEVSLLNEQGGLPSIRIGFKSETFTFKAKNLSAKRVQEAQDFFSELQRRHKLVRRFVVDVLFIVRCL
jgi:hypothetical protein